MSDELPPRARRRHRVLRACPLAFAVLSTGAAAVSPSSWQRFHDGLVAVALVASAAAVVGTFRTDLRARWAHALAVLAPSALLGPWSAAAAHLGIAFSSATVLGSTDAWSHVFDWGTTAVLTASLLPAVAALTHGSWAARPTAGALAIIELLALAMAFVAVDELALLTAAAWLAGAPPTAIAPQVPLGLLDRIVPAGVALGTVLRLTAGVGLLVLCFRRP